MEKKILVAVDNSRQSTLMLDYVALLHAEIPELTLKLLNVHPQISTYVTQEARTNPGARQELDAIMARHRQQSLDLLETAKARLMESGVPQAALEISTQPFSGSTSTTILKAALKQQVDAMVTGRRGLSKLMELYSGSVSNGLIQGSKAIPIWTVGGRIQNKNILVPVDGSRHSLAALDHLAFMFQGNPDIVITLFHVRPKLRDYFKIDFTETHTDTPLETVLTQENDTYVDKFYGHAIKLFSDTGFAKRQLVIKTADSLTGVDSMIADEVETGGFDTIVMGRRGRQDSLFTGSVTKKVLSRISDRAVWIIP